VRFASDGITVLAEDGTYLEPIWRRWNTGDFDRNICKALQIVLLFGEDDDTLLRKESFMTAAVKPHRMPHVRN